MTRFHFSPRAERDLDGILNYIARDKPDAAVRFVARIRETCARLGDFPELGELCADLAPGLRMFCVGNYVVYYTSGAHAIRVERVLHAAQDDDAYNR